MNLSFLETFIAIVETGNLNRAAEQLHVTQSTVTARLNNLEQNLGQPLFHRKKSGAVLTSAGFKFERYAQLMTDLWRQARQETALPDAIESVCNMGCHPDLWPITGSQIFADIKAIGGSIALSSWNSDHAGLEKWLSTGLIDMALSYTAVPQSDCLSVPIGNELLVQVATHPRKVMRWDPAYVYVDLGEEFRKSHAAAYADGDTPTVVFGSPMWALDYLLHTGGSGYFPKPLIRQYLLQKKLFAVEGAAIFSRPVFMIVRNSARSDWPWFEGLRKKYQRLTGEGFSNKVQADEQKEN